MDRPSRTLGEAIDEFARETGAPDSLVQSVTALFTGKGIALDDDAAPYVEALREAFLCDARLRAATGRAKEQLAELQDRLLRLQESWERQFTELDRVKATLGTALENARRARRTADPGAIVPGPRELQ